MENLIGDWKAKQDIHIMSRASGFMLRRGAIIAVTQIDKDNNKVLIEFGPRNIDWKNKSILDKFEKLD